MYCSTTEVRRRMFGGAGAGGTATVTALPEEELRDLIEQASRFFDLECGVEIGYFEAAFYPTWESNHMYVVGDIITPTTRNSHIYRVTTAGTSGASEPSSWPTGSGQTVTSGTVTFTEYGSDVVATEKTFYGNGTNYLRLSPYVPGTLNTSISLPEGYTVPTFTELEGHLVINLSGVLPPFRRYYDSDCYGGWLSGVPVTVSAIWGFSATPPDVKMAVIELVINLHRETDPTNVKLVSLEGQPLRERIPPRVLEIAKKYRFKTGASFV